MVQFELYQGAGQGGNNEPDLGLGGSVVIDLISELPGRHNYIICIDNFFTSAQLVNRLTEDRIGVVGTVESNRIGKCPLIYVNDMKKTERWM